MARVLILGGGCRGRQLAMRLAGEGGHAVRMVTRTEAGRAAIEAASAECVVGDPGRLGTLRSALEGVTVACWLMATARGRPEEVGALHGPRLRAFVGQAIDTTMRGFVYEAPPANPATVAGERVVADLAARNAIPVAFVRADPNAVAVWLTDALSAIGGLLEPGAEGSVRYPERQSP